MTITIASRLVNQRLRLCGRRLPSDRHRPQTTSSPHSQWPPRHPRRRGCGHRRGVVTSSTPPSPDVFIERPEIVVLAESSLYDHSWVDHCATFYPPAGLHFASIDIAQRTADDGDNDESDGGAPSLKSLERTLADDLSRLGDVTDPLADVYLPGCAPPTSSSAHALLIARGPLQCLVAQYFLESLPLAGLVLVDPLLLPEDGRAGVKKKNSKGGSESRWDESLSDLISLLDETAPQDNDRTETELSILRSLARGGGDAEGAPRPLRLEPGCVPTLVCYGAGRGDRGDFHRVCAERTAAFHTCGGRGDHFDQVAVVKVPKKGGGEEAGAMDDLDRLSKTIYEWYEEAVA